MSKKMFDAMLGQYAKKEASGNGYAAWENGVHCKLPSVTVYGACEHERDDDGNEKVPTPDNPVKINVNNASYAMRGKNLFNTKNPPAAVNLSSFKSFLQYYSSMYSRKILQAGRTYTISFDYRSLEIPEYVSLSQSITGFTFYYKRHLLPAYDFHEPSTEITHASFSKKLVATDEEVKNANCIVYCPSVILSDGKTVNVTTCISNVQMEIGDHETPYEPFFDGGESDSYELLGVRDVRDELNLVTGKGIRRIDKKVFDGTEAWYQNLDVKDGLVHYFLGDVTDYGINGMVPVISNLFETSLDENTSWNVENTIRAQSFILQRGWLGVVVSHDRFPSVESFKSWLSEQYAAGNPLTAYFKNQNNPRTFSVTPTHFVEPKGYGQVIQQAGDVHNVPIKVEYVTHS